MHKQPKTTEEAISGISYATAAETKARLEQTKKFAFIAVIRHHGEAENLKDHCHFYAEPSERINLKEIRAELNKSHKDFMPLLKAKETEWLLYTLHDKKYLKRKKLRRRYHYSAEDYLTNDKARLTEDIIQAIGTQPENLEEILLEYACKGTPFRDIVLAGDVAIAQTIQAEKYYSHLMLAVLDRKRAERDEALRHAEKIVCGIKPQEGEEQ